LTLKKVTNGTQRLYEAEADAEAQYHLQDVIVSFVAGSFITFALLFVGMRAIRKPRANVRSELIVAAE